MKKEAAKILALIGVIPVIAFANPGAEKHDPLFCNKPAYEEGMPHPFKHPGKEFQNQLPPYLHRIELKETQKESIKGLMEKAQSTIKDRKKFGVESHISLQEQIFSKDYSAEKVADMIRKQSAQHEEHELNKARLDRAIYELLTPEQQQQVLVNLKTFSEHLQKLN